ncbi:MAG: LptF/LptG family permease, partial [Bacteroidetes bacterium]|nr:LptF/LptG family permease [Bacteroidota bacterium]
MGKKDKDEKSLSEILIYDHRAMQGNNIVLAAKSGKMEETADKKFLVLTLKNGVSYKDMVDNPKDIETRPMVRDKFEERVIRFDLSEFKMSRTNEDLFKNNYQMLNLSQLNDAVDSLEIKNEKRKTNFTNQLKQSYYAKSNSFLTTLDSSKKSVSDTISFSKFPKVQQLSIIESATNIARSTKAYSESILNENDAEEYSKLKYQIEWHRKFTLSIACIVLFFIGAPL